MFAVSRDDGQSWQLQFQLLPGSSVPEPVILDPFNSGNGVPTAAGFVNWSHVTLGPAGDIYVSLFEGGGFSVYHSTDAGTSFVRPDYSGTAGLPFGPSQNILPGASNGLPIDQFRQQSVRAIAADPARPGSVYVAEGIGPVNSAGYAFDPGDINFSRSTDAGQTWQTTVQIGGQTASVLNDDNNGQIATGQNPNDVLSGQALPRLVTDAQGDIAVIWYDTRRDPAGEMLDVFATVSTDGGKTFSPNFRVTSVSFDPNVGVFTDATGQPDYYMGDFLGLAMANGTAYAAWTDTRNGNQDIEFTRFSIHPPPAPPSNRFAPNNTPVQATNLGEVVTISLPKVTFASGAREWFRVLAAATGNLTVSANLAASGDSLRLDLYNAGGTALLATGVAERNANGKVIGQTLTFPGHSGQTYLVLVLPGPAAVAGTPAVYTLDVQSLTANLGTQVYGVESGNLSAGQQAYYALTAPASGSLNVTLRPGANVQGNFHVEVLDPSTFSVLASGQAIGKTAQANLTLTQRRAVYVHVFGSAGARGNYSLQFINLDQFAASNNQELLFPAGLGPSQEAVADLNHDGKPDVVVSDALSNTVSVLLNNGDGTFQAPRQYTVGAFTTPIAAAESVPNLGRAVVVADLTKNGIPDIIVTNYASGDVSVLLGNGDGTFQPQRRFDATANPFAMAVGDLTGNGIPDLVVVGSNGSNGKIAVLLGRGDGTFLPPLFFPSPFPETFPLPEIQLADLNGDGRLDLLLTSELGSEIYIYLGNGDGTFRPGVPVPITGGSAIAAADLNGDHIPDIVTASYYNNTVSYVLGNGDGTFTTGGSLSTGQSVVSLTVADFGSAVTQPDGTTVMGPSDGVPDLLVAASGEPQPILSGPPQILFYPGQVNAQGAFTGFGNPIVLASPSTPIDIQAADLTGDGAQDLLVVDQEGLLVLYGPKPVRPLDDPPSDPPRDLGTVVHVLEPTETIVPGNEEDDYTLTVPTEAAQGAGDEVLDFSGDFQGTSGAGITMQVLDASGKVLGSGDRFRISAPQGAVLTLHVFGLTDKHGNQGSGAYTLDIDVLPQVVSAEAQPLLPGETSNPGGATASLVVTLQGDRLDPTTAQNPANYVITWAGPDGKFGTADDQVLSVDSVQGVVYDPSTNVDVTSGNTYPTAVKQTLTFLFDQALPAGNYQIQISNAVQTAAFNADESGELASATGLNGHPVATLSTSKITEGVRLQSTNLVQSAGALGSFSIWEQGTPFFQQLHDDLGALLDGALTDGTSDAQVTTELIDQVLTRFDPALGATGQRPVNVLALWTDPVSLNLEDPSGDTTNYNLDNGQVNNGITNTFISVSGNIEVIVVAVPNDTSSANNRQPADGGSSNFTLTVGDVPATARGGVILLGQNSDQTMALTDALQGGTTVFNFGF
jgi:hypothetical protein